MICGIYKITNNIDGMCYVGCSKDIYKRWKGHLKKSSRNYRISNALQKYGKDNFTFEILLECPTMCFDYWEQHYIAKFNCISPNGYNLTSGGEYRKEYSEETRKKISLAHKGRKQSPEQIAKRVAKNTGKVRSSEVNDKHRDIMRGENNPMFGRRLTDEQKQYLSSVSKGKPKSEETRARMKAAWARRKQQS